MMKFDTPITQFDLSIFLGVKLDNHGASGVLLSLVCGKIFIISSNTTNQQLYSFSPTIKLLLQHETPSTVPSYNKKLMFDHKQIGEHAAGR